MSLLTESCNLRFLTHIRKIMQTIKIFLASSAELAAQRKEIREFISVKNDRLHEKGIYLRLVQWEYFLDAVSDTRLQHEYNKELVNCDIALCLFYTKVGKFTHEEFEEAYKKFKQLGKPYIYTYFYNGQVDMQSINPQDFMSLQKFKQQLADIGHFYTLYNSIEEFKYKFSEQLDRLLDKLVTEQTNAIPPKQEPTVNIKVNDTQNSITLTLPELKKDLLEKIERQEAASVFEELEKVYDQMESSSKTVFNRLRNEFMHGNTSFDFLSRVQVFVNGLRLKK